MEQVNNCTIADEERKKNVLDSLDLAKEALKLDFKDGESWYLVGNAWFINFFVNFKKLSELETAIKAYNEAVLSRLHEGEISEVPEPRPPR